MLDWDHQSVSKIEREGQDTSNERSNIDPTKASPHHSDQRKESKNVMLSPIDPHRESNDLKESRPSPDEVNLLRGKKDVDLLTPRM